MLGWFFRLFNRGFDLTNRWYTKSLHYVVRYAVIALIVYAGMDYLAYGMFKIVPTGFIPTQDQGYLLSNGC